jgi:phytoene dehydrogenase-like protein
MADSSVIVVGGGIAGLASGIYAQANGWDTTIFEMHDSPGGLCTSWRRHGYVFDGCIHWFVGGKPDSEFRPLWDEVGATDGLGLVAHDRVCSIRDLTGNEVVLWSDIDRLEAALLDRWPSDAPGIRELVRGARFMARSSLDLPDAPPDMMRFADTLKMLVTSLPSLVGTRKYQLMSAKELGRLFNDRFLRRAVTYSMTEPRVSAMALLGTLGWCDSGDANWVVGGSLPLARKLEKRLLDLGGRVSYGCKVERIIVENDRAVGVRLTGGIEHRADYVISAADGHATIFDLLGGEYADHRIRELYTSLEPYRPLIQVSLGVDRDLAAEPWSVVVLLDEGTRIAGAPVDAIWTHHYCYDPSMAPIGKSVVTTVFFADFEHWERLAARSRSAYDAEKAEVAARVIDLVDHAYPGIRESVEVIDVATPMTYVRYTGNWRGSYEGWLPSPENTKLLGDRGMPRTMPGLSGFVMAGQWLWPGGGLPSGVLTGRWAVQTICADAGRPFRPPG